MEELIGKILGDRYQLIYLLGEGGMGAVFIAKDSKVDQRQVAVKILPMQFSNHTAFKGRFKDEIVALAKLNHPNIVTITDTGNDNNIYYIVMEYLEGFSWANRLSNGEEFSPRRISNILRQIANALDYAHAQQIVHRDIKPENIMFATLNQDQLSIVDFGIVKLINPDHTRLTQTGSSLGTPPYMAPEQWDDSEKIVPQTDQYAVAMVIYYALTRGFPYAVTDATNLYNWMRHHIETSPSLVSEDRSDIPENLARVIQAAMAKNPLNRYESMLAFADAFDAALYDNVYVPPANNEIKDPPPTSKGINPILLIVGGIVIFVLLAAVIFFVTGGSGGDDDPTLTIGAFITTEIATQSSTEPVVTENPTEIPTELVAPTETQIIITEPGPSTTDLDEVPTSTETLPAATSTLTLTTAPTATATIGVSSATPSLTQTLIPTHTQVPTATTDSTEAPGTAFPDSSSVPIMTNCNVRSSGDSIAMREEPTAPGIVSYLYNNNAQAVKGRTIQTVNGNELEFILVDSNTGLWIFNNPNADEESQLLFEGNCDDIPLVNIQ